MADGFTVKLEGVEDLKRALAEASVTIRTKAVRGALKEAGKVIQAAARMAAPVLAVPKKGRKPGTVKKAISVRTSKFAKQDGNEGVFIGVRPLNAKKIRAFKKSAARNGARWSGAFNPDDPYYWKWLEFGHRFVPRAGGQTGTGTTTYTQRLRNGRVVTRSKKYNMRSITGRRHHAGKSVMARPFLRPAVDKAPDAINKFMQSVIPQIEKLNRRK